MPRNEAEKKCIQEEFTKQYDSIKDSKNDLIAALDKVKKSREIERTTSCIHSFRGPNFAILERFDLEINVLTEMLRNCSNVQHSESTVLLKPSMSGR